MADGKDGQDHHIGRSACTECQRRKQKCNREWPCNHCQKRNVADRCRFKDIKSPPGTEPSSKRRGRDIGVDHEGTGNSHDDTDDDGLDGFEVLGYAPGHFLAGVEAPAQQKDRTSPKQYFMKPNECPQLQRALQVIPPRPYTDSLIQNFLQNVNFHYYVIYPNSFLQDYQEWWNDRAEHRPIGLQYTCLLLMICACSTQYLSTGLKRKLELDLGESAQKLSEQFHGLGRELHSVIPVGHNHIMNVQQLLHSCYWYKSEARFVECWHVLSAAVREAQELGIHQESISASVSDFEREVNRRVWCVLDTWDWQTSAMLSRPMIIDRSDCDVAPPTLTLEGYSPSPMLHMKIQSQLITRLAARFGLPKNITSPEDVQEYQTMLEEWMDDFPPEYRFKNPDTSQDAVHPWIALHRHYVRTLACSMTLDPMRAFLSKNMNSSTSSEKELQVRKDGIDYAIKLMEMLHSFFNHVWPRDAKFHFIICSVFDTAAVCSSAILHDEDGSAPRRDVLVRAMESAIDMVRHLKTAIPAAQTYYDILTKLHKKLQRKMTGGGTGNGSRKRVKVKSSSPTMAPQLSDVSVSSIDATPFDRRSTASASSIDHLTQQAPVGYSFQPAHFLAGASSAGLDGLSNAARQGNVMFALDVGADLDLDSMPRIDQIPDMGFSTMTDEELGTLAETWKWQGLDLDTADPQNI